VVKPRFLRSAGFSPAARVASLLGGSVLQPAWPRSTPKAAAGDTSARRKASVRAHCSEGMQSFQKERVGACVLHLTDAHDEVCFLLEIISTPELALVLNMLL